MTTHPETEKFRAKLTEFDTAILITSGFDGQFRSRPMAIALVDERCDLWFITDRDSAKVHQILADTRVHVVCQKGRANCVAVSGRASLVENREKIHALWSSENRLWFPRGEDDPDIVLIHVVGERGEYWDNSGLNGWIYAYEAIKALVSGTAVEIREGEQHGRIDLSGAR